MTLQELLGDLLGRAKRFETEAHQILGVHESAPSRVVLLDKTYTQLDRLSVKQDELFRQAIRCVESGLFRAAHVMAWAAFMDYLEERLAEDGLASVRALRPRWKASDLVEFREYQGEFQIIDVAKELKLCTKSQAKALHGLLNKRNECAHPSDYYPELNESLGFLAELFKRIEALKNRKVQAPGGAP